ncbi:hypothetical protein ONS96_004027 [Cadophora gregata f. sp. sojae]|nr:hypothetical protein ONS96_004027 [Cadophora gregata f. sp. sojae]
MMGANGKHCAMDLDLLPEVPGKMFSRLKICSLSEGADPLHLFPTSRSHSPCLRSQVSRVQSALRDTPGNVGSGHAGRS